MELIQETSYSAIEASPVEYIPYTEESCLAVMPDVNPRIVGEACNRLRFKILSRSTAFAA